jgi:tyrosinase
MATGGDLRSFGGAHSTTPDTPDGRKGQLEINPHDQVHGEVGGDMAGFQSPLDPLFWIHHCNIDRFWEIWLTLDDRHNPTAGAWLDSTFSFPDPEDGRRTLRVRDIATTDGAGYTYDDLSIPTEAPVFVAVDILNNVPAGFRRDDRLRRLSAAPGAGSVDHTVVIEVPAEPSDTLTTLAVDMAEPAPLFLRLENVGMETGNATSMWNIYLRIGSSEERHLVGTIAPFGLAGLTAQGGRETLTFDISTLSEEIALEENEQVAIEFEALGDDVEGRPFWEGVAIYTVDAP